MSQKIMNKNGRFEILPTVDQALAMWDKYGMLDNIRKHSQVVREVAVQLHSWLTEKGTILNRQAIETGAILHDIAKTICLGSDMRHDIEGAKIIEEEGYKDLAEIVRMHVRLPKDQQLDEIMVVNYADKRVRHDEVVNIEQRFEYIAERYGKGIPEYLERIEIGRQIAHRTEEKIFESLKPWHTPNDITRLWKEGLL